MRYLLKKGKDGTIIRGTHKESGAPPTPCGKTLVADGPDTQPIDVSTLRGHSPERVDWGVACEADRSSAWPTINEQPSGPSVTESTINDVDIPRESGAQITPLRDTFGTAGPNTQPGDVP